MDSLDATIVVPTHDHGPLLEYSVGSALAQTATSFEILIIGDGVPATARPHVERVARLDPRIRFFDFPKAGRTGEPHRNAVLAEARGRIVCYLGDDDLWLPQHLEQMIGRLQHADFAHALTLRILPGDRPEVLVIDVGDEDGRRLVLNGASRVHFSSVGHTMDAFRRLPEGWRLTPPGQPTDYYMWTSFLALPNVRAVSGEMATTIVFPTPLRRDWTTAARFAELRDWSQRIATPGFARTTQQLAFSAMCTAWLTAFTEASERLAVLERIHSAAAGLQQQLEEKERLIVTLNEAVDHCRTALAAMHAAESRRPR